MTTSVLAEPAPPHDPLPPNVLQALYQLVGYGMWIAGLVLVACLAAAGGLMWVHFHQGAGFRSAKKIVWILGAATLLGSAWLIAGFFLPR